jgi:hypothetical protein
VSDSPPGPDEITLTAPRGRHLCHDREHQAAGKLAEAMVTFGQLGTEHADALWVECWGSTYAMCADCCALTCTIATARRPCLVIHDTRPRPGRKLANGRPV